MMFSFNPSFPTLFILVFLLGSCHPPQSLSLEALEGNANSAKKLGEWLKAAQLFEKYYQLDDTNERANYEAGTNYLKANYPKKALAVLNIFTKTPQDTLAEFNGRPARIAKAYYKIKQFREVIKAVDNYAYPKMYRGLAREHLKALIQLKEYDALGRYLLHYQQSGIYDDKGKSTNDGFLYRAVCNELMLVGETDRLLVYANDYYNWAIARQKKDKRNWAIAAFYQGDYLATIPKLKDAITSEKSPRHLLELETLLGICYANLGQVTNTNSQLAKLAKFQDLPPRHDAFGAKHYQQARIEVALGQKEAAIASLKKALRENAEFWSNKFKEDGLLVYLFGQPEFEEMIRAKIR